MDSFATYEANFCSQRSICPCRRYGSKVAALRQTFSEYGLIKFRVLVECRWLQQLSAIPEVTEVPAFSQEATAALDLLASSFDVQDASAVKKVGHVCENKIFACSCEHSDDALHVTKRLLSILRLDCFHACRWKALPTMT